MDFLVNNLPFADYSSAMTFYEVAGKSLRPIDRALIGCNDRFFLLSGLLHRHDVINPWLYDRCREVEQEPDGYLDLWAREHYKDLSTATPILTPNGWVNHGDLAPGDQVFSQSGKTVNVVATRHFTDSACYRVRFSHGIEIIAGAGHLWDVELPSRKRVRGTFKAGESHGRRTTRKLATLRTIDLLPFVENGKYRVGVKATKAIDGVRRELPIDPYVLGAWLGDGFSADGRICGIDQFIFDEIGRRGYALSYGAVKNSNPEYRIATIRGISPHLRRLGVLGNKHIPDVYMTASAAQRRDLLAGIVDTDGNVASTRNATVTIAMAARSFAEQVQTLANSLGYKARLTPARATNSWQVTFQASVDDEFPPCLLPRKVALLKNVTRHRASRTWYIDAIEPVETVPTNCIQVDAPDGMYLAGQELIPTHNSTVITFAGIIQEVVTDPEITICIFSHERKTASKFMRQIKNEFERNDHLREAYSDVLWERPRKEAPKWSIAEGLIVKRRTNPKEATIESSGLVDGMPTGGHYRLLVYDDVVTQKSVTNPEMVKKTTENWELSDNLGAGDVRKWHIGTRYSFADSYGVILERGALKPRIYPATDDGTITGKPVFMSLKRWLEKVNTQRSTVAAQMLQNPIAGKENMFMPGWFRKWEVRPSNLAIYIMGDPSGGKNRNSDRTAIVVIGIDMHGNKYLLDGYRHRMSLSERWHALRTLFIKWSNERGVMILRVGWESYGLQADLSYFQEQMQRDSVSFGIIPLNWTGEGVGNQGKTRRVERLEPDFRRGKFFLPAVVFEPGNGDCYWHVDEAASHIVKLKATGKTKAMMEMIGAGMDYRVCKSIRRVDSDRKPYDVTSALMEEMLFFPFAPKDDLVDATSRIYDMGIMTPSLNEEKEASRLASIDYVDA